MCDSSCLAISQEILLYLLDNVAVQYFCTHGSDFVGLSYVEQVAAVCASVPMKFRGPLSQLLWKVPPGRLERLLRTTAGVPSDAKMFGR